MFPAGQAPKYAGFRFGMLIAELSAKDFHLYSMIGEEKY
jgi:hypothetical protein